MIGGEFDLSIGSMVGFAGIVIGLGVTEFHLPIELTILVAFGFAVLIGYINGLLVIRTGLPSFIVTLAALFILRGLTLAVTRGVTGRTQIPYITEGDGRRLRRPALRRHGLHRAVPLAGGNRASSARAPTALPAVAGVPASVLWWLGLTALATWVLLNTNSATGSSPPAATRTPPAMSACRWRG